MNNARITILSVVTLLLTLGGIALSGPVPVASLGMLGVAVVCVVLLGSELRRGVVAPTAGDDDEGAAETSTAAGNRLGGIVAVIVGIAGIMYGGQSAVEKYAELHQEKEIAKANAQLDVEEKAAAARGETGDEGGEQSNPMTAALFRGGRMGGFLGRGRDGATTGTAGAEATTGTAAAPSRVLIADPSTTRVFTYDPTNWTVSGAGVYRTKQ